MYINWRNSNNKSAITSISNRINVHFYAVITPPNLHFASPRAKEAKAKK